MLLWLTFVSGADVADVCFSVSVSLMICNTVCDW